MSKDRNSFVPPPPPPPQSEPSFLVSPGGGAPISWSSASEKRVAVTSSCVSSGSGSLPPSFSQQFHLRPNSAFLSQGRGKPSATITSSQGRGIPSATITSSTYPTALPTPAVNLPTPAVNWGSTVQGWNPGYAYNWNSYPGWNQNWQFFNQHQPCKLSSSYNNFLQGTGADPKRTDFPPKELSLSKDASVSTAANATTSSPEYGNSDAHSSWEEKGSRPRDRHSKFQVEEDSRSSSSPVSPAYANFASSHRSRDQRVRRTPPKSSHRSQHRSGSHLRVPTSVTPPPVHRKRQASSSPSNRRDHRGSLHRVSFTPPPKGRLSRRDARSPRSHHRVSVTPPPERSRRQSPRSLRRVSETPPPVRSRRQASPSSSRHKARDRPSQRTLPHAAVRPARSPVRTKHDARSSKKDGRTFSLAEGGGKDYQRHPSSPTGKKASLYIWERTDSRRKRRNPGGSAPSSAQPTFSRSSASRQVERRDSASPSNESSRDISMPSLVPFSPSARAASASSSSSGDPSPSLSGFSRSPSPRASGSQTARRSPSVDQHQSTTDQHQSYASSRSTSPEDQLDEPQFDPSSLDERVRALLAGHLGSREADSLNAASSTNVLVEAVNVLEALCPDLVKRSSSLQINSEADKLMELDKSTVGTPELVEYPLLQQIFTTLHFAVAGESLPSSMDQLKASDPKEQLNKAWKEKLLPSQIF